MGFKRSSHQLTSLFITQLLQLWTFHEVCSFVPNCPNIGCWNPHHYTTHDGSTLLSAKTKRTKKKKTTPSRAASAGGFGKLDKKQDLSSDDGDYSVFPSLEPDVEKTLVPWQGDTSEDASGALPTEIFERLEQIYGFDQFNSDNSSKKPDSLEEESASLASLISTSSAESNDLFKPPSAEISFADILASDSGKNDFDLSSTDSSETALPLPSLAPFSKFRVLHVDPMVLAIDDFFPEELCDKYIAMSDTPSKSKEGPMQIRSRTVGTDYAAKAQRTSTTWFHHYKRVPELMAKASRLLGLDDITSWEEPQIVRYRRNEKFTWHLDALAPAEARSDSGGQRIATLLVYLADLTEEEGGATMFRDLGSKESPLKVRPKKGSALLFFPSAGGIKHCPFDIRTLHCGEAVSSNASHDKWIAQLWLRQGTYTPTAPAGNTHAAASEAISEFCYT